MSVWLGCYDDGWKGLIVPEAFAHPRAETMSTEADQLREQVRWLRSVIDGVASAYFAACTADDAGQRWDMMDESPELRVAVRVSNDCPWLARERAWAEAEGR